MFIGLLPASLYTYHMPSADGSGPSGRILGRIQNVITEPDGSARLVSAVEEDFVRRATLADNDAYGDLTLKTAGGAGTTDDTAVGGVMALTTGAVADQETTLKGGVAGVLNGHEIFMESRQSLTLTGECFIGLHDAGANVDGVLDGSGLPDTTKNYFGFHLAADGTLSFVSQKAGGTLAVLATDLGPNDGKINDGEVLSLGFIYNMVENSSHGKCDVFVASEPAAQIPGSQLTDEAVPKNVPLAVTITSQASTTTDSTMNIDWVYCYASMS